MSKALNARTGIRFPKGLLGIGVLPILLVATIILFASVEARFLSYQNLFNVVRQSTYLVIVSMGQMFVLLTAGLDLSVGSTLALVSVVTAMAMTTAMAAFPDAPGLAIAIGMTAGLGTGVLVGMVNGVGVAILRVNPFMMTLGMSSIAFGMALTFSGGTPISGMPGGFGEGFAYSELFGVPMPMYFTVAIFIAAYVYLNWTRAGRYIYALGSNVRAAELSGVRTRLHTFLAYVLCSLLAAGAGILLTARVGSGEPTIGQDMVLQSIAACVIGRVSLFGGVGRIGNVVLGAFFISLLMNGMNLIGVQSYMQQVVLGVVLIFSIAIDQLRFKYFAKP